MDVTINDYQKLKKQLDEVNNKIQKLEVEKQVKSEQLKQILSTHGVKSVSELKKKKEDIETQAKEIFVKANEYINEASEAIKKADEVLHQ